MVIMQLLFVMAQINITIGIFHLIPIYPMDGSVVLSYFLPDHIQRKIEENGQMIYYVFLFMVMFGLLDGPIMFLSRHIFSLVNFLTGFVDILFGLVL